MHRTCTELYARHREGGRVMDENKTEKEAGSVSATEDGGLLPALYTERLPDNPAADRLPDNPDAELPPDDPDAAAKKRPSPHIKLSKDPVVDSRYNRVYPHALRNRFRH